jgi:hypothetical protein
MKTLLTDQEYKNFNSNQQIPLLCKECNNTFYIKKAACINAGIKNINSKSTAYDFCSSKCYGNFRYPKIYTNCMLCKKEITITQTNVKYSKTQNFFCSKSCAATYNNTHKTTGYRRSKLEIYIEQQLKLKYPNLEILFNNKTTIESELDIYIPSLKLAFELNGIFHYEPIYSTTLLEKSQNRDKQKLIKCYEKGIELCVIDTSKQKYFTLKSSQIYLQIIINLISLNITRLK